MRKKFGRILVEFNPCGKKSGSELRREGINYGLPRITSQSAAEGREGNLQDALCFKVSTFCG
jgi:hypothetical protein